MNTADNTKREDKEDDKKFPGYPHYDSKNDIYNHEEELKDTDPNDLTNRKSKNLEGFQSNEKGTDGNFMGDDLDVPGAELDNAQEEIGSEDEENNYYSLGGDNHDD
jgi:hypothetical protein